MGGSGRGWRKDTWGLRARRGRWHFGGARSRGHCGGRSVTPAARRRRCAFVPVSDFKGQAADWLKRVATTGQPVVITQNGKAAGALVSPAEFDRLTERSRLLEAVDEGLADEKARRVVAHDAVVAEMKRKA